MNKKSPLPPSKQAKSIIPNSLYRHYKGNNYKVLFTARHSETLEELIVYQALYGDHGIWVCPLAMFLETVVVNGKNVPRFELLTKEPS